MNGAVEKHAALFADAMIKAIEKGTAPWQQPWKRGQDGYPANFKTRRYYSGSNLLLLLAIGIDRGYRSTHWGGFQQIRAAGGQVRKGETGTPILIVRESTRKREGAENVGQMEDEKRNRSIYVTAQHVWNVDQADGVGNEQQEETQEKTAWTTQEAVEAVAADAHIRIIEGANDEAFYKPSTDMINMPPRGAFEQGDGFYHVLLHELGHATAHPSRLDRPEYKTMVSGHGNVDLRAGGAARRDVGDDVGRATAGRTQPPARRGVRGKLALGRGKRPQLHTHRGARRASDEQLVATKPRSQPAGRTTHSAAKSSMNTTTRNRR